MSARLAGRTQSPNACPLRPSSGNEPHAGWFPLHVTDVYRDHAEAARGELLALRRERQVIDAQIASIEREIGSKRETRGLVARCVAVGVPAAILVACGWWSSSRGFICRIPRYHVAWRGAEAVQQAGELWINTASDAPPCPSVEHLVQAKMLDPNKANDPWGRPYRLACEEGSDRVWAYSLGSDGLAHTADDIASDMPRQNLNAVSERSR